MAGHTNQATLRTEFEDGTRIVKQYDTRGCLLRFCPIHKILWVRCNRLLQGKINLKSAKFMTTYGTADIIVLGFNSTRELEMFAYIQA